MRHELCLVDSIQVTIEDRGSAALRERLDERLHRMAELRCKEHDQMVTAVTIHGRENGWFDSQWVTCCETLELEASTIVKQRF